MIVSIHYHFGIIWRQVVPILQLRKEKNKQTKKKDPPNLSLHALTPLWEGQKTPQASSIMFGAIDKFDYFHQPLLMHHFKMY